MSERLFETGKGRISGTTVDGVTRLSRLRYARAPVGDLRFALPQPVAPWEGVLSASGPSPVAPQFGSRLARVMGDYPAPQSEDCLHLDIWIPEAADGPLPVLVFIHGGAFMTGGGGMACYDGTYIAARGNIIVVNVSHRLGALGFLAIDGIAPPNLGLHDQIAALRWIRQEIGAFGGDAANITVAGQSAGAYSVAAMLVGTPPRALFDRAVMLSAPLGRPIRPTAEAGPQAGYFTEALGIAAGDLAEARNLPVDKILEAQGAVLRKAMDPAMPDRTTPPFWPNIDGELLTENPARALDRGVAAWCPVLIGATRDEYAAFFYENPAVHARAAELLAPRFEEHHPGRGAQALRRARLTRPGATALELLSDLWSDQAFIAPTLAFSRNQVAAGGRVHTYLFDWEAPNNNIGACHCIELPFMFGNLDVWRDAPMLAGAEADTLAGLSAEFQNCLISFVRQGDPACEDGPNWLGYGSSGIVRHFDRRLTCSVGIPLWEKACNHGAHIVKP